MKRARLVRLVTSSALALLVAEPGAVLAIGQGPGSRLGKGPGFAGRAAQTFHFTDVTLTDGDQVYEHADIHVRVESSGAGYTRADYLDQRGRRLGFYEAFEVISREERELLRWAVRNFRERTRADT